MSHLITKGKGKLDKVVLNIEKEIIIGKRKDLYKG